MRKHLAAVFLFAALGLHAQSAPYLTVTSLPAESSVSNVRNPILLEGTCSADIVSVTVEYRFGHQDLRKDRASLVPELVESYTLKKFVPGSGQFLYRIFPSLGNLGLGTNVYTVIGKTSSGKTVSATVTIFAGEYFGERAKPVIYLYPTRETRVSVNVKPRGGVSVSDPPIGSGWTVTARPDGRITDPATGRDYPYLFWESPDDSPPFAYREGFVAARAELPAFFRDKLAALGLVDAEIADFLEYWLPVLDEYEWYQIAFVPKATLDTEAPLTVSPKPDTVIRVYFDWKGLEGPASVPPQTLERVERRGFTVVEWGGRKYLR